MNTPSTTFNITIQATVEAEAYADSGLRALPDDAVIVRKWRQFCSNSLLEGKELAESGLLDAKVYVEINTVTIDKKEEA